jgi:hypothetical protein
LADHTVSKRQTPLTFPFHISYRMAYDLSWLGNWLY